MDHYRYEEQVKKQLDLVERPDICEPLIGLMEKCVVGRHEGPGDHGNDAMQSSDRDDVCRRVLEKYVRDNTVCCQDSENDPAGPDDQTDPFLGLLELIQFLRSGSVPRNERNILQIIPEHTFLP
jgi:hypothetical protein